MPKSTLLFSFLAVIFAAITGLVIWQIAASGPVEPPAQVEGALIDLGLAATKPNQHNKKYAARSVLLWDTQSQSIRYEQNGFERLPIASITKLMTAMVAIDRGIPWEKSGTIDPAEYLHGGRLLMQPGEEASLRDLFAASLLGSANNATLAYVRHLNIPPEEFVQEMNRKAVAIGLEQTYFTGITGLEKENISTAYEVARMAEYAFKNYPDIAAITSRADYTFRFRGSDREHTIRNTNKLISEYGQLYAGSKTGYLYEAQYCLVVQGTGKSANLIGVVLGSDSEPDHFNIMQRLLIPPEL